MAALLCQALPAHAWDILSLGAFADDTSNVFHGRRTEWIVFAYKGKSCVLPFNYSYDIGSASPTLILHGITDSRDSCSAYIRYRREKQLPWKHLVAVDWPGNGESDCTQALSFRQAAEAVRIGFEELRRRHQMSAPKAIVGSSSGAILAAYLAESYPETQVLWITPPILRERETQAWVDRLWALKTEKQAAEFVALSRTDPRRLPLPLLTYDSYKIRARRSTQVLREYGWSELLGAMLRTDPSRVRVIIGKDDHLTPPALLPEDFIARYAARTRTVNCGHDIMRSCYRDLPEDL